MKFEYPFDGLRVKCDCSNLMHKDGPLFVNAFIKNFLRKSEAPRTTKSVLNCPHYDSSASRTKMSDAFKADWATYGDKWHMYDIGPSLADAVGGIGAQRSLGNPDQHPVAISSSSDKDNGADLEEIVGGGGAGMRKRVCQTRIKHEMQRSFLLIA